MAEPKTKPTTQSVPDFISSIEDDQKRKDSFRIDQIMEKITGFKGKMWGTSIVGYGSYRYTYKSGRESNWMAVGFSPRKQNLTLYIMAGFTRYNELLKKLGKHKTGKSCLYIRKLEDIDEEILRQLILESSNAIKKAYPES